MFDQSRHGSCHLPMAVKASSPPSLPGFYFLCGIFETIELGMNQVVFSNMLVHENGNSRDAM